MTLMDQSQQQAPTSASPRGNGARRPQTQQRKQSQAQPVNVGDSERAVSTTAGVALALLGLRRGSIPGLLVAGVGGAMIYRGATGHCSTYQALGIDTAHPRDRQNREAEDELEESGIRIEQAFLINRPAEQLYGFWRDFSNLPKIMSHIESVQTLDNGRSHWVASLPRIAGGHVEWDAEITADEPNSRIAWRSLPGADLHSSGEVRFSKAMGDRGTEVHVTIIYQPPGAGLAHLIPSLFTKASRLVIREDLRNFKRLMEIGEIPTIVGQPRGTCMGSGKREAASAFKS